MNFGLYLVKNGIIDQKTFIEMLETQYSTLPPLISILRDHLKIENEKLLEIINHQDQNNCSFTESARSLLGQPIMTEAIQLQNNSIKTIAEILLERNLIDEVTIQSHINSYQSQPIASGADASQTSSDTAPATSTVQEHSAKDDDAEVSQAAIDSMKEIFGADSPEVKEMEAKLHASQNDSTTSQVNANSIDSSFFKADHSLDKDFVSELVLKFNAKEMVELAKSIKDLVIAENSSTEIATITKRLHTILGAAKLSGAKILAESIQVLENYLKQISDQKIDQSTTEKLHQYFSLLVKLRNHIEQEKSESGFFDETSRQNQYESLRQFLN